MYALCSAPIGFQSSSLIEVRVAPAGGALDDPAEEVGVRRDVVEAARRGAPTSRSAPGRSRAGPTGGSPGSSGFQLVALRYCDDRSRRREVVLVERDAGAHVEEVADRRARVRRRRDLGNDVGRRALAGSRSPRASSTPGEQAEQRLRHRHEDVRRRAPSSRSRSARRRRGRGAARRARRCRSRPARHRPTGARRARARGPRPAAGHRSAPERGRARPRSPPAALTCAPGHWRCPPTARSRARGETPSG